MKLLLLPCKHPMGQSTETMQTSCVSAYVGSLTLASIDSSCLQLLPVGLLMPCYFHCSFYRHGLEFYWREDCSYSNPLTQLFTGLSMDSWALTSWTITHDYHYLLFVHLTGFGHWVPSNCFCDFLTCLSFSLCGRWWALLLSGTKTYSKLILHFPKFGINPSPRSPNSFY